MPSVELSAGTIEYSDNSAEVGGDGRVLVLLHGVNMDGTLWDSVVDRLPDGLRCIRPTLPLGAHRHPMRRPDQVTHRGVAALVGGLLEALDLWDVTLVMNDWGGAQYLLVDGPTERIAGAALVACEAFDNFPPGAPGKAIATSARVPGMLWMSMQLQRFGWFRRAPGGWGWMSKRPVPTEVMDTWFGPALRDAGVRRDLRRFALSTPSRDERSRLAAGLATFDKPVLVIWATEDRLMPPDHGPRLVRSFPDARLVEVEDSYTLIPIDRPELLADELSAFVDSEVGEGGAESRGV